MSKAKPYGGKTRYEDAVGARNALGIVMLVVLAVIVAGVVGALVAFHGHATSDRMVWCAAPGETVDAAFKAEYPELRMPKSECDRFNR